VGRQSPGFLFRMWEAPLRGDESGHKKMTKEGRFPNRPLNAFGGLETAAPC